MLSSLVLSLTLSSMVSAISEHQNVALYWGQNSAGTQQDLATYCSTEKADIYVLSFIDIFGSSQTDVNFASACTDTFSDGLLHCTQIGEDIKTCQSLGKTILLSMGGASGAYGFSSDSTAEDFAGTLWNMFGAGSDSSVERPFDDAVVDGFDFDIENNSPTGYAALATKLRSYFSEDTSKTYYLSAAPQCPYPDASVGDLLENASIDFAFIQFYNNYCATTGSSFNWDTWNTYAESTSPNKNIKLFVGLPAASGAAGSGYATIDEIKSTFEEYIYDKEDSYFGGFSLWDASWSTSNQVNGDTFGNNLQSILDDAYSDSGSSESSSATSASTSSSSSSETAATTSSSSSSSTVSSTSSTTSTSSPIATTAAEPTTSAELTTSAEPTTVATTSSTSPAAPAAPATESSSTIANTIDTSSSESLSAPTSFVGDQAALTTQTTLSTSSTSAQAATTSASSSSGTDCSSLSGLAKAQCLNENFEQGLYLGSATSCTEGDIACAADGSFAICNYGSWVEMACSAGTTCYAYNSGDEVDVGCDYTDSKSSYQKRDGGYLTFFKRHIHHPHRN